LSRKEGYGGIIASGVFLRGKFDVGGSFFVVFFFLSFGLQIKTGLYVLGFPTRTFFQEEFQSSRRVRGRRRRGDGEKL
jgi:hypothetical protein